MVRGHAKEVAQQKSAAKMAAKVQSRIPNSYFIACITSCFLATLLLLISSLLNEIVLIASYSTSQFFHFFFFESFLPQASHGTQRGAADVAMIYKCPLCMTTVSFEPSFPKLCKVWSRDGKVVDEVCHLCHPSPLTTCIQVPNVKLYKTHYDIKHPAGTFPAEVTLIYNHFMVNLWAFYWHHNSITLSSRALKKCNPSLI